jgi:hypothetical protein
MIGVYMNTSKKRALLDVVKFVCLSVGGAVSSIWLIKNVPPEVLLYSACAIGLGFMLYTIYSIRLDAHTFRDAQERRQRALEEKQNKPIQNYDPVTGKPLMEGYPEYSSKSSWNVHHDQSN